MATPSSATARPSLFQSLFGFSRGLQAILSISQPALAAIIALRGLPSLDKIVLGLIAATAGYFAVFAVNDLLDVGVDRRRFDHLRSYEGFDVDSAAVRHPLAQGFLSYAQGIAWIAFLSIVALVAAFLLSPMAALLFLVAAALEVIYCSLRKVTAWKFLPTGLMVAVGATAGWFAVTDRIEWLPLTIFFVWMFAWEIGGRNIVNDWSDVEEDAVLGIKTVPVVFGFETAGRLIFGFLLVTFFAGVLLGLPFVADLGWLFVIGALVEGWYALIGPGIRLLREPTPQRALALFNRASFYPMVMLPILLVSLLVKNLTGF